MVYVNDDGDEEDAENEDVQYEDGEEDDDEEEDENNLDMIEQDKENSNGLPEVVKSKKRNKVSGNQTAKGRKAKVVEEKRLDLSHSQVIIII